MRNILAGLLLVLLSRPLYAGISYHSFEPELPLFDVFNPVSFSPEVRIDVDRDGTDEIAFALNGYQNRLTLTSLGQTRVLTGQNDGGPVPGGVWVEMIAPSGLEWRDFPFWLIEMTPGQVPGSSPQPWDGATGLIGVEFKRGTDTHYGLVELRNLAFGFTYARSTTWETTPGLGITAQVVPEPSSGVLLLAGLLAWLRWHRGAARGGVGITPPH